MQFMRICRKNSIKSGYFCCKWMCAFSNKAVTKCEIPFSNWQNYVRISTVKSVERTPILKRFKFVNYLSDINDSLTNLELQRKERGGKQRILCVTNEQSDGKVQRI